MARKKKATRRDPNTPLPTSYYSGAPTLTDLPAEAQLNVLNKSPRGDRGRPAAAIRGYNDLERVHRQR